MNEIMMMGAIGGVLMPLMLHAGRVLVVLCGAIGGVLMLLMLLLWVAALVRLGKLRGQKAALELEKEYFHREQRRQEDELQQLKRAHADELADLRHDFELRKADMERHWTDSRKALVEEFKNLAAETLQERSKQLKSDNRESMGNLLAPLHIELQKLAFNLKELDKNGVRHTERMETVVRELLSQTQQIGRDAVNLTKALKGESKTQGNWGEMILEKMLESSGLQRDVHYRLQETLRDSESGSTYRPDAIVLFPHERGMIIDSKVSLTAYSNYIGEDDEAKKKEYLEAHVRSVRKHVDELAQKDYSTLRKEGMLRDSVESVLMFIPNESSYIAAVQADRGLVEYALRQKVLLVGPTNLGMALKMAHHLWLNEARLQNVENIFSRAKLLYDKFAGFYDDFSLIEKRIGELQKAYSQAKSKGFEGQGNFLWQCRELEKMGVRPRTNIGVDSDDTAILSDLALLSSHDAHSISKS